VTYGGDMIAFVSESTRLVTSESNTNLEIVECSF